MHRAALSLAAVALFVVAGPWPEAAGAPVEREIVVGGAVRSYRIHVPTSWDRVRPLPVLFVFHGAGSDAESMVRATGFDALSERTNVLVVYPRAPSPPKRYDVDPPPGRTSADVLFVDALLARFRARFPLDERRIFATGFSNGAALCYRLAAERPEVFAAVAPVAGYLPRLVRTAPVVPVPLLHVHGTDDHRLSAGDAVLTWARWNGCAEEPRRATHAVGSLVLERAAYSGPTLRCDTELVLVHGQGHVWSGGPAGAISQAVLDFLWAHPRGATAETPSPRRPDPPDGR